MKEMSQAIVFAEFTLDIDRKNLIRYFLLIQVRLRQKNGFVVLVNVHEVAKNRKVLCKQYTSTDKILSPQKFYGFLESFSDCSHYSC